MKKIEKLIIFEAINVHSMHERRREYHEAFEYV